MEQERKPNYEEEAEYKYIFIVLGIIALFCINKHLHIYEKAIIIFREICK